MISQPGAISARVERIRSGKDLEFLLAMPSGFAILGKHQPSAIRGCCMLLPHSIVPSPNDLEPAARVQFFSDLCLIGDAILEVTRAERINYLVLCNQVPELHGHAIPRFAGEDPKRRLQGPFEAYDFAKAPVADAFGSERQLHGELRTVLKRLLAER